MEGYIAQIIMFAGNFEPRYWAYCRGQILSIAQNTALFSLLGTTYGGNGQTTFALPDFHGRSPLGVGQGPGLSLTTLGELSGSATQTISLVNLPAHTHTANINVAVTSNTANSDEPAGSIPAAGQTLYASPAGGGNSLGGVSGIISATGGGQPVNIRQPYLGMNFIICLSGIFPSRN